jgi:hypothetical protein
MNQIQIHNFGIDMRNKRKKKKKISALTTVEFSTVDMLEEGYRCNFHGPVYDLIEGIRMDILEVIAEGPSAAHKYELVLTVKKIF